MIIECKSREEAERLIQEIRGLLAGKILNFIVNEVCGTIYLIINGQIDLLTDEILESVRANKVFSSLDPRGRGMYFVMNPAFRPEIQIGRRKYDPEDHLLTMIAGPCEIENYEDLYETAAALKEAGVSVFRAMPRKPRVSPYAFQGVGDIGWEYMARIRSELDLPVLAEVFSQEEIDLALHYGIDMIQIGSRNMQNYDLIKRAARSGITTVLKKGMWCNNDQLLKAAEYFFVYGKGNVIMTERGISTHEVTTRNTFDLSTIRLLKNHSRLPVAADASHGTGTKELIIPMNTAAVMLGADVLEVEVHVDPDRTIKPGDYYQMLTIPEYQKLLEELRTVMEPRGMRFDFE